MIQLSYNGELYSYDNKTATTVTSNTSISVLLHPYADIEGAKLYYSQGDTEGLVDIENDAAEIPGAYLVTGDLQVALKLASGSLSNTFTINVTVISSSGDVTDDDIQFTMDNKKRLILVPGSQSLLAIQYDSQSEIVTFKFPRYQEGVDLSTKIPYVNYKRPQLDDLCKAFCTIEKTDDTFIYFSWMVDAVATQYSGTIQFQVEFADGEEYRWQSQIGELPILTSLYTTGLEPYTPDILEQYVQRLNALIQDSVGIPSGGAAGQILFKRSNTDYDVEWQNYTGIPSGGNVFDVLRRGLNGPVWEPFPVENDNLILHSFTISNGAVTNGPTVLEMLNLATTISDDKTMMVAYVSVGNEEYYILPLTAYKGSSAGSPGFVCFSANYGATKMISLWGTIEGLGGSWLFEEIDEVEEAATYTNFKCGDLNLLSTEDTDNLVEAINEVNSKASRLLVTVTYANDAYAADYSYSDIRAALQEGREVDVVLGLLHYKLAFWDDSQPDPFMLFSSINLDAMSTIMISPAAVDMTMKPLQTSDMGAANAGKFLVVGSSGYITTKTMAEWQGGNY